MAESPLVCSLTSPELRRRRNDVLRLLRRSCREQRPLALGYQLGFETADGLLPDLATLIEAERQCCPFLTFHLTVEPNQGRTYLELTGPLGTREFLETELGVGPQASTAGD
jgi:hypothetical protein